ncbi:RlpA-like double-psi beta-barrel domain-containing protein [Streptomyces violarus]|uniref:RlpA-like double-psi beta-barrel domain-containing protein n=1 Tax=Streptomyces violarus TaxID=67380 RepID=UPI0021BF85A1|nr:RlpA-like double-psi beta-barrel domain-containing protein [Streptomyces violarus]MCT9137850.1 RlpA-like double-psi beta-barrel domain-containing protein [Streptomyces violarus]
MASHSRRRPLRERRTALVFAVAVAAVGVLLSLVVALRPDSEPNAVRAAAEPAATRPSAPRTTPERKPAPKPKPSKASPTPTPTAATSSARPSPTSAPRSSSPRPASGTAPLTGRIQPQVTYEGVATHYDAADGDGACLYGPSPDLMVAAMNHTDYETSRACGAYILVRAANGASVTVRITNECPLPCAPGQLDLSKEAFAKLAGLSAGRIPITWSLLSPGTSDTVSIRYKSGSSRHWCGVQALGHRNPLARLEVRTGSGWSRLTRTEYNYFLSPDGTGCGGALRLTDIYGEQLTVDGVAIRPDAVQPTRVQFARH